MRFSNPFSHKGSNQAVLNADKSVLAAIDKIANTPLVRNGVEHLPPYSPPKKNTLKSFVSSLFSRNKSGQDSAVLNVDKDTAKMIDDIALLANARLASSDVSNISYEVPLPAALRWFGKFMD